MTEPLHSFISAAKHSSRNPLGIIALFIVLVYGIAGVVAGTASFDRSEALPLIYFLVIFPVLVLGVFTWLVVSHSQRLYAPSDFRDDASYLQAQNLVATVSLVAARAEHTGQAPTESIVVETLRTVAAARGRDTGNNWQASTGLDTKRILWVDDRPDANVYEKRAFGALGIEIDTAVSSGQALDLMRRDDYSLVISDLGRPEGERAGLLLLQRIREQGNQKPYVIYTTAAKARDVRGTPGLDGATGAPDDLFRMVTGLLSK